MSSQVGLIVLYVESHLFIHVLYRRCKKWWFAEMYYLIDQARENAFALYQLDHPRGTQNFFVKSIIHSLCGFIQSTNQAKTGRVRKRGVIQSLDEQEWDPKRLCENRHIPEIVGSRRCALCYKGKVESATQYRCPDCHVSLCMNGKRNCYAEYHGVK